MCYTTSECSKTAQPWLSAKEQICIYSGAGIGRRFYLLLLASRILVTFSLERSNQCNIRNHMLSIVFLLFTYFTKCLQNVLNMFITKNKMHLKLDKTKVLYIDIYYLEASQLLVAFHCKKLNTSNSSFFFCIIFHNFLKFHFLIPFNHVGEFVWIFYLWECIQSILLLDTKIQLTKRSLFETIVKVELLKMFKKQAVPQGSISCSWIKQAAHALAALRVTVCGEEGGSVTNKAQIKSTKSASVVNSAVRSGFVSVPVFSHISSEWTNEWETGTIQSVSSSSALFPFFAFSLKPLSLFICFSYGTSDNVEPWQPASSFSFSVYCNLKRKYCWDIKTFLWFVVIRTCVLFTIGTSAFCVV